MIPNKLQHGDSTARLFDLWNQLIDYLLETRLVAGSGISINKHPAGTTIESTATATGGGQSAPAAHPFDAEIINKGTEENPQYYVRIYNSALPDSPYAGNVIVNDWSISVPVTELKITSEGNYWIRMTVDYTQGSNPPYTVTLALIPYGSYPPIGYTTWQHQIGSGNAESVTSNVTGNIEVTGRWV